MKNRTYIYLVLATAGLLVSAGAASAAVMSSESYSVPTYTISGGGTLEMSSSNYSLRDLKAQAVIGTSESGNYDLRIGGVPEEEGGGAAGGVQVAISREGDSVGDAIIVSWTTSPTGAAVDVYRLTTTEADSSIYTTEASAWTVIMNNVTVSSTIESTQVGTGYAQAYYKVIPTGQTALFGTAEAVGKFNKDVPVGLSLFSVPFLPTATGLNTVLGAQLSNGDLIYYFTGVAWVDSTLSGGTWSGGVTDVQPDLGYWIRVQATPKTITVCGPLASASSRNITVDSGLNLDGTAYPVSVTLEDSSLGAALTSPSSGTGKVYYFTGSAWLDSTWNSTSWENKGVTHLQPTLGYWIRRDNTGSGSWTYPRPY